MVRNGLRAAALVAASTLWCATSQAADLEIVARSPSHLEVRLTRAEPDRLCRVALQHGRHRFVWENLSPDEEGIIRLADDRHLRPECRLRCESRVSKADPVVFDDLLKGVVVGKRRLQFGVPVSTFGGPGYLVPGVSDLKRDRFGNFWLYMDRPPHAVLKYDANLEYQFALLTPDRALAHDLDAEGNLYLLHPGNWISKHGPLGEPLAAWELPFGRDPGEFVSASGLVVDADAGLLYLSDEMLGRVQRFNLELELSPYPQTAWGWIGREDLAYQRPGEYKASTMYYQLDRPRELRLDGQGHLFVSCEHYVSKFDLVTGHQLSFGRNPVLGWGGTFSDSAFSQSAALDGHWQLHWLVGVDSFGNIYLADRKNRFVVNPRLQVFRSNGTLVRVFDIEDELRDQSGQPVYVTAVKGLASGEDRVWLVDAAGRIYEGPPGGAVRGGGRLYLGPGAAGRQFDLTRASADEFTVETQEGRVRHTSKGLVMGYPTGESGTGNCEREGRPVLADGETSMWIPVRLGDPFGVTLLQAEGEEIPPSQYETGLEDVPGLFGTRYDYFRVTNRSGRTWQDVRFLAETVE